MKWILILTAVAFVGFAFLLWQAIMEGYEDPVDGTVITYPDEEQIFSEFETDEHSPENLDIDKAIKTVSLRNKLKDIEEEREIDKHTLENGE